MGYTDNWKKKWNVYLKLNYLKLNIKSRPGIALGIMITLRNR